MLNIKSLKTYLKQKDLVSLERLMGNNTDDYQIFNPFTDPVIPKSTSLTKRKLDDLQYGNKEFEGKTVADLGCNLGFFSFLAVCSGATKVVAYDFNNKYINIGNILRDNYIQLFPKYKNKLSFIKINFNQLPDFGKHDVLMVHSLIHWFFVYDPNISLDNIISWLSNHCNESLYFEGCVEGTDSIMTQYKVKHPERLTRELVLCAMKKYFSRVELRGNMGYNPSRIMVRCYK